MDYRIKDICKEKGLLFKDLAKKMGVSDVTLRHSINHNPTMATLEKISNALGVSVSDLLNERGNGAFIVCPHCGKRIFVEAKI